MQALPERRYLATDSDPLEACVRDLTLRRRGLTLVQGRTFALSAGEILGVAGPSGCGKTTLLRTIAGLHQPAAGQVHIPAGNPTMVFRRAAFLPWRTARENVQLAVVGAHHSRGEVRASDRLEPGLADAMDLYPAQLSGDAPTRVLSSCDGDVTGSATGRRAANRCIDPRLIDALRTTFMEIIARAQLPTVWVSHDFANSTSSHAAASTSQDRQETWSRPVN